MADTATPEDHLPVLDPTGYATPAYVDDPERWALCIAISEKTMEGAGEGAADISEREATWGMATSLYRSDLPMGEMPAELREAALKAEAATQAERDELWGRFPQWAPKPAEGRGGAFSLKRDGNGLFIHTHRARSKSYASVAAIPKSTADFIESTG